MRRRDGKSYAFTMIELLVVLVIIGLLAALLIPAIGMAVRRSNEAAVAAEEVSLGQALADFRSKYGEYPPSRILVSEAGTYLVDGTTTSYTAGATAGIKDITDGQLAIRSVSWLRRAFPRVAVATGTAASPPVPPTIPGPLGFHDFNGNGKKDGPYVLTGDECLTFFLGGIPALVRAPSGAMTYGMTGFNRDPTDPFVGPVVVAGGVTTPFTNRQPPLYEFKAGRLIDLDDDGFPSYLDSLSTGKPIVLFTSYGSNNFDPNDYNDVAEAADDGTRPITLKFTVGFTVSDGTRAAVSPGPNPYTQSTTVVGAGTPTIAWHKSSSYQLISSGYDGLWGVGGVYEEGAGTPLPVDSANTTPGTDSSIRIRERDNVTNIHNGRLD
jgi:prepilin-type N-terminal cleavage/methylation domain-containing protein